MIEKNECVLLGQTKIVIKNVLGKFDIPERGDGAEQCGIRAMHLGLAKAGRALPGG